MRRCLPVALVVLSVGLAACSTEREATRNQTGAVATEGSVDAFEIKVGDCFNEPQDASESEVTEVQSIAAVPCDQPHDSEVYHEFQLPDGDYPGDQAVAEAADNGCGEQFQGFVGKAYEESALDFYPITPTEDSWTQGEDRTVSCVIYRPEEKSTGSLKGTAA